MYPYFPSKQYPEYIGIKDERMINEEKSGQTKIIIIKKSINWIINQKSLFDNFHTFSKIAIINLYLHATMWNESFSTGIFTVALLYCMDRFRACAEHSGAIRTDRALTAPAAVAATRDVINNGG